VASTAVEALEVEALAVEALAVEATAVEAMVVAASEASEATVEEATVAGATAVKAEGVYSSIPNHQLHHREIPPTSQNHQDLKSYVELPFHSFPHPLMRKGHCFGFQLDFGSIGQGRHLHATLCTHHRSTHRVQSPRLPCNSPKVSAAEAEEAKVVRTPYSSTSGRLLSLRTCQIHRLGLKCHFP